MIFSCGETTEALFDRLCKWHPYFAWHPVKVGKKNGRHTCAWLRMVERRNWAESVIGLWEYRLPSSTPQHDVGEK